MFNRGSDWTGLGCVHYLKPITLNNFAHLTVSIVSPNKSLTSNDFFSVHVSSAHRADSSLRFAPLFFGLQQSMSPTTMTSAQEVSTKITIDKLNDDKFATSNRYMRGVLFSPSRCGTWSIVRWLRRLRTPVPETNMSSPAILRLAYCFSTWTRTSSRSRRL